MEKKTTAFLAIFLSSFFALSAQAQKLPGVQDSSVWAPPTIKIDGKATEWEGKFKAYNGATGLFYTLSNDDKNLYLTVMATDAEIINYKLLSGGLTLIIQQTNKKNDKAGVSISYPIFDNANRPSFYLNNPRERAPVVDPEAFYDSIMVANNTKLTTSAKSIKVMGISDIDSIISVYNTDNIKAAGLFDNKKRFTCELSIPLALLNIGQPGTFFYHIMLNGGPARYMRQIPVIFGGRDANGVAASQDKIDETNAKLAATYSSRYAATDFWGQYTFAKKP